ncbi:MAG: hypothetical protein L6Q37_13480 [Bdellovibrionaceae bacterium]|nr:hypothetical protein [Pseudobdellovibrionaceae bacterium]NUM58336.1 hypothetical protein [Pseudobdellovibrionaceae bacterium]
MKLTLYLIIYFLLFPFPGHSFTYLDFYKQEILDSGSNSLKNSSSYFLTSGFGNFQNSFTFRSDLTKDYNLSTTNKNFVLFSINYNELIDFNFLLPFKDPTSSRESRVDSEVKDFSVNFSLLNDFKTSIFYRKNNAYYFEDPQNSNVLIRFPNLGFSQFGIFFYKVANKNHQSIFIEPIILKNKESSGSWIYVLGLSQFYLVGLEELQQIQEIKEKFAPNKMALSAEYKSLSARIGYSQNWFWEKFFISGVLGIGSSLNYQKIHRNNSNINENTSTFNSTLNSIISFSTGYFWKESTLGVFINAFNNEISMGDWRLDTTQGTMGTYYSFKF